MRYIRTNNKGGHRLWENRENRKGTATRYLKKNGKRRRNLTRKIGYVNESERKGLSRKDVEREREGGWERTTTTSEWGWKRAKNEKWRDRSEWNGVDDREVEGKRAREKESKLSWTSARQIVFLGAAAPPHGAARSDHSPRSYQLRKKKKKKKNSCREITWTATKPWGVAVNFIGTRNY